jgi:hypothetical protein
LLKLKPCVVPQTSGFGIHVSIPLDSAKIRLLIVPKLVSQSKFQNLTSQMSSGTIVWLMTSTKQQMKRAGQGLPIVTSNTIDAIHDVCAGKRWGEQLTAAKDRLIQENPHLVKFIESQISRWREIRTP